MPLDTVPWAIKGGAVHSTEVARALAYTATGGESGVTRGDDLRVRQLPTASTSVRVSAGSAAIVNSYSGQSGQSYIVRNTSDENIAIPAATTARSDLLVLRIDDPQYGGTAVPDAQKAVGPYVRFALISNVGSTATTVPSGIDFPCIPLARIDLPANTGTVTDAHIKDLRKIANPKPGTLQIINKRWGDTYDPLKHTPKTVSWTTSVITNSGGIAALINDVPAYFAGVASVQITGAGVDNLRYAKGIFEAGGTNRLLAYCYNAAGSGVVSETVTMDVTVTGWVLA